MGSYLSAMVSHLLGAGYLAEIIGAPALLMTGWGFLGHLVTLDDDMPGGWSNPEGSRAMVWKSVGALLLKSGLFMTLLFSVYL